MQVSAIPEVSRVGALSGNARAIGRAQVTFLKITIKTFVRNENRSKNPNKLYLVGGSFGLREFAQIRYDVHKLHGTVDPALKEKLKQNNVTLESEYKLSSKITKLQNSCFGQFHIQGFIKLQAYKKPC
nr:cytochrome c oxidase assembly protein COX16 homolog, mitochondrial isoform X2 [Anser cygnoides]